MNNKHLLSLQKLDLRKIFSKVSFLFAILLLAVFLRIFLFEIYSIPSGSMEETLVPDDRIVVSKLAYGAALPRSPLEVPWFNAFFLLNRRAIAANDTFVWHYRRMPGLSRLQRGDVTVFRYPPDSHQSYIKRCVALPGDTVRVNEGVLYVNGQPQLFPATCRNDYQVWFRDQDHFIRIIDSMNIHLTNTWDMNKRDTASLILSLTPREKRILLHFGIVDSVKLYVMHKDRMRGEELSREYDKKENAPPDFFGPLVVPRKGMTITVNEEMLCRYGTALERYEHFTPEKQDGLWLWRGRPVRSYTFRQNYYFMMGDNRHNSTDSRWWGVVTEELIIGKAKFVLWSGNFRHFRWERVFKEIE